MNDIEAAVKGFFNEKHFDAIKLGPIDFFVCWLAATVYSRDRYWPDFFYVEVKRYHEKLTKNQHLAMYLLNHCGVPVYVFRHIADDRWRIERWVLDRPTDRRSCPVVGRWKLKTLGVLYF
jgi:hypothetical protein